MNWLLVDSSRTRWSAPCSSTSRSNAPQGIGFKTSCIRLFSCRMALVLPVFELPASARITEESTPCTLSIHLQPDSRGLGPRIQSSAGIEPRDRGDTGQRGIQVEPMRVGALD